jgi:hypothetical protein
LVWIVNVKLREGQERATRMTTHFTSRWATAAIFVGCVVILFPLAVRFAAPFATFPYDSTTVDGRVLLLWPDHIELQPIRALANFSPRPPNAEYSFMVPPERQSWVATQLKAYPSPTRSASWSLRVRALESGKQEIELELIGDGIYGVVYEANQQSIIPLKNRLAGPGFAFIVFGIDFLASLSIFLLVTLFRRLLRFWNEPASE